MKPPPSCFCRLHKSKSACKRSPCFPPTSRAETWSHQSKKTCHPFLIVENKNMEDETSGHRQLVSLFFGGNALGEPYGIIGKPTGKIRDWPNIWPNEIIFHHLDFPEIAEISLTKPPFGMRSCEVAIIWPEKMSYHLLVVQWKLVYLTGWQVRLYFHFHGQTKLTYRGYRG